MWIECSNPVHSLADSQRMREAIRALELSVVVDVAMTETARVADYVLPASSQFEKADATFFNLEFPRNGFHLRHPLFAPLQGTLPEAEIHARFIEALGELTERDYAPLRRAARLGRLPFALAFGWASARNPRIARYASIVLYRTLGPRCRRGSSPLRRCGRRAAVRSEQSEGCGAGRFQRAGDPRRQPVVRRNPGKPVGTHLRGQRLRGQLDAVRLPDIASTCISPS